jgi:hypothetical protein
MTEQDSSQQRDLAIARVVEAATPRARTDAAADLRSISRRRNMRTGALAHWHLAHRSDLPLAYLQQRVRRTPRAPIGTTPRNQDTRASIIDTIAL